MSKRHYIIPIFVPHEGCPHNCVFCNQDHITGSESFIDDTYVSKTIVDYLSTIDSLGATIEVSFYGGTFTAINIEKQSMLLSVARKFKEQGRIHKIRLSTRPDYINSFILDNLKQYSVDIIELGVQSMDEDVLQKSGRGHTKEDVINASKLIKDYGFILGHQVMVGLPGDTFKKDIDTVKELIGLKPDMFRIYPALVIKDTPMEILYKSNVYTPYTLEEAINVCKELLSIIVPNDINIIRIGLQPTDNIAEGKDIVAGPFHPAFRELVEGSLYCDMIYDFAKNLEGTIHLRINNRDISKLYTNRKQFFLDMKKQLTALNIQVSAYEEIDRGVIEVLYRERCYKLSTKDYINIKHKEGKIDNL